MSGGQRNDITQARQLMAGKPAEAVIADKGYDANWFVELIEQQQAKPVIPPRRNRPQLREYDRHL